MHLTVLGCAGSFPSAHSPASSYLVEHGSARLVLDMGNGSISSLQRHVDLDDPASLDGVVISHGHVDHCADLGSLYVIRAYHPRVRFPLLPVLGPVGFAQRMAGLYGTSVSALSEAFAFIEVGEEPVRIGPFAIRSCAARHPGPSHCIRVDCQVASLAYSGDTGPNEDLVELAAGVDLAVFEASFVGEGGPLDLHLTATQAADHARRAGARRLLATHLVAWNDDAQVLAEAQAAFDGPVQLARPGLRLDLSDGPGPVLVDYGPGS